MRSRVRAGNGREEQGWERRVYRLSDTSIDQGNAPIRGVRDSVNGHVGVMSGPRPGKGAGRVLEALPRVVSITGMNSPNRLPPTAAGC